ncbi:MAG: F0F1 ATP synthase subunit B [Candidatus Riflebacteria bacterium HGW-Riflebacteria-2]|jgi:F-type H+-transporting ATPase subunit b|nr:MAG: F0F1 ATP synthase subunit B [Candidatus Riflebacteria bacterium HGW-Riflebacteria-2]
MAIDWFTIVAQAFNFLVLMWLLKYFLYQPILNAIDEREKLIATKLGDADQKMVEAQKDKDEFKQKLTEIDQNRADLFRQATEEAKVLRQRLVEEARQAAEALSAKRQVALQNEERDLHQAIRRKTQNEVFDIARKVLADLATTDLEERLGEVFARRLREIDGQTRAGLAEIIKTAREPVLIRSAFDLPSEQRATIQNALNVTFSAEVRVRFETSPDLIGGVELIANGQKVAWSIADYLTSLEREVETLLQAKSKPVDKADAESEKSLAAAKTP